MSLNFATITHIVALKAGHLKREQILSGLMADIFSNLYMAVSVQYYHNLYNSSTILTDYIIESLIRENQIKINTVIDNLGYESMFIRHLKHSPSSLNIDSERKVFKEIIENPAIMNEIKKNIYIKNNILEDLEKINKITDKHSDSYNYLYNKVINVGEYPIVN